VKFVMKIISPLVTRSIYRAVRFIMSM